MEIISVENLMTRGLVEFGAEQANASSSKRRTRYGLEQTRNCPLLLPTN